MLERGDSKALLDPELNGYLDDAQAQRMVLAARLCISQSARARPKANQVLQNVSYYDSCLSNNKLHVDFPYAAKFSSKLVDTTC